MKKINKTVSTFDRIMKDKKRKDEFEEKYKLFLLSEFLIYEMEKEKLSVRRLSKKAGLSTSIIQNIRAGTKKNVTLQTLSEIAHSFGYDVVLQKGKKAIKIY